MTTFLLMHYLYHHQAMIGLRGTPQGPFLPTEATTDLHPPVWSGVCCRYPDHSARHPVCAPRLSLRGILGDGLASSRGLLRRRRHHAVRLLRRRRHGRRHHRGLLRRRDGRGKARQQLLVVFIHGTGREEIVHFYPQASVPQQQHPMSEQNASE